MRTKHAARLALASAWLPAFAGVAKGDTQLNRSPSEARANSDASQQVVPVHEEPSHRPIFTNAEVRVLDVLLAPHATTLFHTHVSDLVGLTVVPGALRTEVPGEAPVDEVPDNAGDVWYEAFPKPPTHRGTNLGNRPIHYLALELLRPNPGSVPSSPPLPPSVGTVVLENGRIRISRINLYPGRSTPAHAHSVGHVLAALSAGGSRATTVRFIQSRRRCQGLCSGTMPPPSAFCVTWGTARSTFSNSS